MAGFSEFVGNQAAISEAKRALALSRVTIIVGAPVGGRTTFVRCMEDHFKDSLRFEFVDLETSSDVRMTLRSVCTRKQGVMEAYSRGADFAPEQRGLRVVLDDIDAGERNIVPMLEDTLTECGPSVGVILVTDSPGLRKLSLLKKKGALVITLTAPGKDAVARWARRTLLPSDPSEEDADKLRQMLRACRHSIYNLKKAYADGSTVAEAAQDAMPSGSAECDNATTLVRLFASGHDFDWLYDTVCYDGGSMMGQLAWHNAAALMSDDAYVAALTTSMSGLMIERGAHLRHDFVGCALGHALALAPYAGVAPKADKTSMTYTTTMAQGGARAVARRALTATGDDRSVSECAWDACMSPAAPARRGRKK